LPVRLERWIHVAALAVSTAAPAACASTSGPVSSVWLWPVALVAVAVAAAVFARQYRRAAVDPELLAFRREVASACDALDVSAIGRLRARRQQLGQSEEDAAIEIERLDGLEEFLAFRSRVEQEGLPSLDTQHRALGSDRCHFWTPAFLADRVDAAGKLFLTDARLVFIGGGVTAVPWSAVHKITRADRDLVVVVPARNAVFRFRCNTFGEALRASFVAETLAAEHRARRARPPL